MLFDPIHHTSFIMTQDATTNEGFLRLDVLLEWIEKTASEHASLGNVNFEVLEKLNQAWVLYQWQMHIYRFPLRNETIKIKTWVQEMQHAKSLRLFEVYVNESLCIELHTLWLVMNTQSRKLESLKVHGAQFLEHSLPTKKITFDRIGSNVWEEIHTITVSNEHLDFVGHVNNIQYIKWCMDIFQQNKNRKPIKKIHVQFAKESILNEVLTIHQNENQFKITHHDELRFWMKFEI
jgi:medium-chain acyl-[acyl-carrier-protein] hydrolase